LQFTGDVRERTLLRVAGVDVGGRRKGFHAAVIERRSLLAGPVPLRSVGAAIEWLLEYRPVLVAVDAPIELGPRACERDLARTICGLYYTPAAVEGPFYEWMRHGLELYAALRHAGLRAVECFPTATWTRLAGPRGSRRRAGWSAAALSRLPVRGVPSRIGQDGRDAIGAAYTAWLHVSGRTESFGSIVVPRR